MDPIIAILPYIRSDMLLFSRIGITAFLTHFTDIL
jgi:hypothetical protein